MWRNPKYFPADNPTQTPPAERGERLATLTRGDGVELRVALAEFEGRPFVSLRVWERDREGRWWPVKGKGVSLRLRELPELLDALGRVEDLVEDARS